MFFVGILFFRMNIAPFFLALSKNERKFESASLAISSFGIKFLVFASLIKTS